MKIAVRLDDITPDMDWERFLKCKALLDRYQVKPLIGVVPDNRDKNLTGGKTSENPDFWEYIKSLEGEGWSVAMHGFRHLYGTKCGGIFPLNHFSEFAGVSYQEQLSMIRQGKQILADKGIDSKLFMAPAHSYDNNTLKALKEAGFTGLTDGFGNRPYTWKGLNFYPISFRLSSSMKKKKGFTTMVIHPGTSEDKDFKRYEHYFNHPLTTWIPYSSYLQEKPAEISIFYRMSEYIQAAIKSMLVKLV